MILSGPATSPFAACKGLVSSVTPSEATSDGIGSALLEVDVPLSEHEQRLLEQIERALVDDDPKFASSVRTGDRRLKARRRMQIGGLLFIVGLGTLVGGGAVAQSVILGVLGFLVMFSGGVLVVLNYKAATGAVEAGGAPAGGPAGPSRGGRGKSARRQPLKNRLEERFRRRYDQ
jgi:hypothetical protein